MIILLLFVIIIVVVLLVYNYDIQEDFKNINAIKIDDIEIIKRTPEYQKLIDKLINEKKNMFTKEEI